MALLASHARAFNKKPDFLPRLYTTLAHLMHIPSLARKSKKSLARHREKQKDDNARLYIYTRMYNTPYTLGGTARGIRQSANRRARARSFSLTRPRSYACIIIFSLPRSCPSLKNTEEREREENERSASAADTALRSSILRCGIENYGEGVRERC